MAFVPLEPRAFLAAEGVEDWRVVGEGACACFRTGSFAGSARLAQAIAELPGVEDHPPGVDLRDAAVTVRLITIRPGYYGLGARDLELARQISALARTLGASSDPSAVQNVQVSIDGRVGPASLPFWRAVLGYQDRGDDPGELCDPRARGPLVYFQPITTPPGAPHPHTNRIHLDLWVPHDQRDARIAAALAAGGRVVSSPDVPWASLEDPEGNRVCVCAIRR